MSPFRRKGIKSKNPDDLISDKITVNENDNINTIKPKINVETFNPPPSKKENIKIKKFKENKKPTDAGKSAVSIKKSYSKGLHNLELTNQYNKFRDKPSKSGIKKTFLKSSSFNPLPKEIYLDSYTKNESIIPQDFGTRKSNKNKTNISLPSHSKNKDNKITKVILSSEEMIKPKIFKNSIFSRDKEKNPKSKGNPPTFEDKIHKNKIKSKKP